MKSEEICAIMKACKESGVREFSFKGLKLVFGRQTKPVEYHYDLGNQTHLNEQIETSTKAIQKEEILTKEQTLALMAIEDPIQYEALVAQGELEDSGGMNETEDY